MHHTRILTRSLSPTFLGLVLLPILTASLAAQDDSPPQLGALPAWETPIADNQTGKYDFNLGPTGMRGWIFGYQRDHTASREILVRLVEAGSPADGIFRPSDLIVGVEGKPFDHDARESLAEAITRAEVTGQLHLLRWRSGQTSDVTLNLEVLGEFSPTAPFDCAKSRRILENSADFIVTRLLPEYGRDEDWQGVPPAMNGLLLLSMGEAQYLPQVRRYARRICGEIAEIRDYQQALGHWSWYYGYYGLFLGEYYLLTGDATILPHLEKICAILARGQGVPGIWCHGLSQGDHLIPGYGAVNSPSMVCFMALALADKCGVNVDRKALADTFAFFSNFVGRGAPGYGDHPAVVDSPSSNGKSGGLAAAYHLMGAPKTSLWFARLAASSNHVDLYTGHTGNYWNHLWTPIGAHFAGRDSLIAFCWRTRNNYELMRHWTHGLTTNPDYNKRECVRIGYYSGTYWGPGACSLYLAIPRGKLQIFGAPQSVFAKGGCPETLGAAMERYRALDYQGCLDRLNAVPATTEAREPCRQLNDAARLAIEANRATMEAVHANLKKGDLYLAAMQMRSLDGVMSANMPDFGSCRDRLSIPEAAALIAKGEIYYHTSFAPHNDEINQPGEPRQWFQPMICFRSSLRRQLEDLSRDRGAGVYANMAARFLAQHPMHPYQRYTHGWLPQGEYLPLRTVFPCHEALALGRPNTNVNTYREGEVFKVSDEPGELLPPIQGSVEVALRSFDPATLPAGFPLGTGFEKIQVPDKFGPEWKSSALPISGAGKPGQMIEAHLSFEVGDPAAFREWFLTARCDGPTCIYLNGFRILTDLAGRKGYNHYLLKRESAALLKPGRNILSFRTAPPDPKKPAFADAGLDALPVTKESPTTE